LRSFESEKCELCVNCFVTKTEELLRNVGHFKTPPIRSLVKKKLLLRAVVLTRE